MYSDSRKYVLGLGLVPQQEALRLYQNICIRLRQGSNGTLKSLHRFKTQCKKMLGKSFMNLDRMHPGVADAIIGTGADHHSGSFKSASKVRGVIENVL